LAFYLNELIYKGAEAEIWKGKWFDLDAIFKIRKSKPWRHPKLDNMILESRTMREAKIMYQAFDIGVNVPYIYDVSLEKYMIIMEYVNGITLKDLLSIKDPSIFKICKELGNKIAMLHENSIIHGDLTPSNVIIREGGELCILDFGLANFSNRIEDMGVDIHLFLRALESNFARLAYECFESFKEGYSLKKDYKEVFEKVKEIRRRGRYVSERRLVAKL